jgi:hypothetical protein
MKTKRKVERTTVMLGFGISALVIGTLVFYGLGALSGGLEFPEVLLILTVIALVVLATYMGIERMRTFKAGLPLKDEREKRIWYKAGYYSYLVTIYLVLGLSWFSDYLIENLGASSFDIGVFSGIIILVSASIFVGLYFYFRQTGKTE